MKSKKDKLKKEKNRTAKATTGEVTQYEEPKGHPLFIELSELYLTPNEDLVWRESSRWLKFIEVIEPSGRWSKPHVATISLHNLVQLRSYLANGTILFHHKSNNLSHVIDDLIDALVADGHLDESKRYNMRKTLLLPHIHQYQKKFQKELDVGKSLKVQQSNCMKASPKDMLIIEPESEFKSNIEYPDTIDEENEEDKLTDLDKSKTESHDNDSVSIDLSESQHPLSKKNFKINKHFLKKIPVSSKTVNILIGEVDYLVEEIVALVQLAQPILLEGLTEVLVPTKFLFIALGPKEHMIRIRELGRCMGTLFSDELFQNDIHDATEKCNIIAALDDFLDQSTVLPPGTWDTSIRLAPPAKTPSREERLILKMIKVKKDKPHTGGHGNDPGLIRTGRFCGGLIGDIKRKLPWYFSDFKDALNFQCIPAIAFLYFACLTPIITFGGLLGYATDKNMGAIESLLSGLICGVSFSLFAGQPMTIMGSTGPVLVFESILNAFSKYYGIDYMGFRCYVGLWVTLFLLIITVTDLSFLVKYITRFTEELFAILIALIFVHESIDKLLEIKHTYHYSNNPFEYSGVFNENTTDCFKCVHKGSMLNGTYLIADQSIFTERQCEALGRDYEFSRHCKHTPDVFFFSVILYLLTFIMAMYLRDIKFSTFFPTQVRSKLSNFGVVITILAMVLLDYMTGLDTPKLHVPNEFHPTIPDRGWFINPIARQNGKWWLIFAAIIPALLATILIFMDQHITAVIVNRKGNKLKKSGGYHLDLFICAICIGVNSLLGLPWFVAATVLSMNHVIALRKISSSSVPGESAKLIGVIEQRVTGVLIFVLIGCSIFLTSLLEYIPMPVLYAVFMYMGITPMSELEFYQRVLLILMPKKHQPDLVFLRHVRLHRVNLFTFIQVVCLLCLFLLKLYKTISITFPIMVLALVFIRLFLNYVFTEKELSYLDDIIPGTETKRKRRISLNELLEKVELLEREVKKPSRIHKESFTAELNQAIIGNAEELKNIRPRKETIRFEESV